ncbi:hypothetical protein MSS93_15480 [Deinococcus radiodurans]|nr:hypothetical protein MSS93_15480 [Deinococcus radiodurans]
MCPSIKPGARYAPAPAPCAAPARAGRAPPPPPGPGHQHVGGVDLAGDRLHDLGAAHQQVAVLLPERHPHQPLPVPVRLVSVLTVHAAV